MVHHLWHRHEAPLKVAQLEVAALGVATNLHVHVALGAPMKRQQWGIMLDVVIHSSTPSMTFDSYLRDSAYSCLEASTFLTK